jgi:hypothetical protein
MLNVTQNTLYTRGTFYWEVKRDILDILLWSKVDM